MERAPLPVLFRFLEGPGYLLAMQASRIGDSFRTAMSQYVSEVAGAVNLLMSGPARQEHP
jgi:hypothetical protein